MQTQTTAREVWTAFANKTPPFPQKNKNDEKEMEERMNETNDDENG